MRKNNVVIVAFASLVALAVSGTTSRAQTQAEKTAYPAMAPVDQYLMPDQRAEIALARTGAPASVSDGAEVMVLERQGFTTAVKGTNGFVCVVERSWGAATDASEFWNPKIRSPICFNPAAARTFAPIFLMKTKLALAGRSKAQILAETSAALDKKELPALKPGSMCYMMSKQQYLNDRDVHWHPHLMFFVSGDAEKSWGANVQGSPIIAANDPEERVTIMMVPVWNWSDGTPGPSLAH
ncbi:MAG: hypothetical protein WA815_18185 [Terracidiphilus sp.]